MKWYYILLIIAAAATCIFILILALDALVMSRPHKAEHKAVPPDRFLIRKPNRDAFQKGPECSGYSSAYVLRHLGREADGKALYGEPIPVSQYSGIQTSFRGKSAITMAELKPYGDKLKEADFLIIIFNL